MGRLELNFLAGNLAGEFGLDGERGESGLGLRGEIAVLGLRGESAVLGLRGEAAVLGLRPGALFAGAPSSFKGAGTGPFFTAGTKGRGEGGASLRGRSPPRGLGAGAASETSRSTRDMSSEPTGTAKTPLPLMASIAVKTKVAETRMIKEWVVVGGFRKKKQRRVVEWVGPA